MIDFDIRDYPLFMEFAKEEITKLNIPSAKLDGFTVLPYHIVLQNDGFKSADVAAPGRGFMMNEADFAWFVLKWM